MAQDLLWTLGHHRALSRYETLMYTVGFTGMGVGERPGASASEGRVSQQWLFDIMG